MKTLPTSILDAEEETCDILQHEKYTPHQQYIHACNKHQADKYTNSHNSYMQISK